MLDFSKIKTFPIAERENKFHLGMMLRAGDAAAPETVPNMPDLVEHVLRAKAEGGKVVVMMGGAVIKEGCGALLIDLMKRGVIDHISGNGAVSIHDFEIALIGQTSEHVPNGLRDGSFGMVEETGALMNRAIREAAADGKGYGYGIGRIIEAENLPHKEESVLYTAYKLGIPATIHVAVGGDIIHQHPACDGAALGATSFRDFEIITETIASMGRGALLNIGSAVLMPEVFLKALTIARNLGHDVSGFTTANFDFLDMYRPRTRVLQWPEELGGTGIDIRGGHRQTVPALYGGIVNHPRAAALQAREGDAA
ncbi:GSU2086 family protein [Desulfobaculum sp.]